MEHHICGHEGCERRYSQLNNLRRHEKSHKKSRAYKCAYCRKGFARSDSLLRHSLRCGGHVAPAPRPPSPTEPPQRERDTFLVKRHRTAFNNATITWRLDYKANRAAEVDRYLDRSTGFMLDKLSGMRRKHAAIKFNLALHVEFEQASDESIRTIPPIVLVSEQFECYRNTNIRHLLSEGSKQLQAAIVAYTHTGLGGR